MLKSSKNLFDQQILYSINGTKLWALIISNIVYNYFNVLFVW